MALDEMALNSLIWSRIAVVITLHKDIFAVDHTCPGSHMVSLSSLCVHAYVNTHTHINTVVKMHPHHSATLTCILRPRCCKMCSGFTNLRMSSMFVLQQKLWFSLLEMNNEAIGKKDIANVFSKYLESVPNDNVFCCRAKQLYLQGLSHCGYDL